MTDETREQIKRDADQYATVQYGDRDKLGLPEAFTIWDAGQEDFEAGATHQHPISYAAGLDDALRLIDQYSYGMTKDQWQDLTRKIEALKTEIKK